MWNDRQGDHFACHILDVHTGEKRTLPHPFYTISSNGDIAVAPDFRRVNDMRPGYGYTGLPDPNVDQLAPEDSGIFRLDLETGEQELIISIADIAKIPYPHGDLSSMKHYFNHLLLSPDGSRFIFLNRWRGKDGKGFGTRMFTARPDGSDIRIVNDSGLTSHFIWRDPFHILAWAHHPSNDNAFYLQEDGTGNVQVIGKDVMTRDGHCTYIPGSKWILNDMYPDKDRKQEVYLFSVATGEKITLGKFHSPPEYTGEWRCDTHPRPSPDGRGVTIDSPHGGNGRQIYLIDISRIAD